jgi:hypothetical protein
VDGSFNQKINQPWLTFSSHLEVHDAVSEAENPFLVKKCQSDEEVRMDVTGPVFLFGRFGTSCACMDDQELTMTGRTGLAWKMEPWSHCEVVVRGGPSVTCADALRPQRVKEQSELLFEVQCRCPLPGKVNLEYQSSAVPALSVTERERLKQDLRLAFPVPGLGQFRVGARHNLENSGVVKPWTEGMEFYIGLDLKR